MGKTIEKTDEKGIAPSLPMERPRLTKDALFLSLSEVIDSPPRVISIGRNSKKTEISINSLELEDKSILTTFFYTLIYYACRGYSQIRLTRLMEDTGFEKRGWDGDRYTHGFYPKDKARAINALTLIKNLELRTRPFGKKVPYFVLRLFPQAEPKDIIRLNPFAIALTILDDGDEKIRDAIVKFIPNFDTNRVYFFPREAPEVLTISNRDAPLKLLAIFIMRRKAFMSQNRKDPLYTTVKIERLLEICGLEINWHNPSRTRDELEGILEAAKRKEIIRGYSILLEGRLYTEVYRREGRWFMVWLESEMRISF